MENNYFTDLDSAARCNLSSDGVNRYNDYKAQLINRKESYEDIDCILRGFIWEEIESEQESQQDEEE